MAIKQKSYLDLYNMYLSIAKSTEHDTKFWSDYRSIYYNKQYELIIIDGDMLRKLQGHLEDDKDYKWVKKEDPEYKWVEDLRRILQKIDRLMMSREHATKPEVFYQNVESMLTGFIKPATGNDYNYLNEALSHVKTIKENGKDLAEIQKRIEAISLLILNMDQNKIWWSKPHKTDVAKHYMKLHSRIGNENAYDKVERELDQFDVDPGEYGFNGDARTTYRTMLNNAK